MHPVAVLRRIPPLWWLFLGSFGIALCIVLPRGEGTLSGALARALPGSQAVVGAWSLDAIRPVPAAPATLASTDAAAVSTSAGLLSPAGESHARFAEVIEQAITAADAPSRGAAIQSLAQASAAEAMATLQQVLMIEEDATNRALALQVLLALPDAATHRAAIMRIIQPFAQDADPYLSMRAGAALSALQAMP